MRMLPRSAAGGVLIVVLVLSVAPPARSETLNDAPPTVPALPVEESLAVPPETLPGQTTTDTPAVSDPEATPPVAGPGDELPEAPTPTAPTGHEDPAVPPSPEGAGDVDAEEHHADDTPARPAEQPELPDAPDIPEIPETLPVTGTLVVIAEEAPMPGGVAVEHGGGDTQPEESMSEAAAPSEPEQVLLATDEGPMLELDPGLVAAAETGQRFSGEVALEPETRAAMSETLAAEAAEAAEVAGAAGTPEPSEAGGSGDPSDPTLRDGEPDPAPRADSRPTEAPSAEEPSGPPAEEPREQDPVAPIETGELLDLAVTVAGAQTNGERLAVGGLIIPGTGVGSVAGPKAHSADVILYTGGGAPSDAQLTQLVRDAGTYWVSQTGGIVSGLSVGAVKRSSKYAGNRAMRCTSKNTDALWNDAAKQFGRTANSYLGSGRHLIVLVDDACGSLSGGRCWQGKLRRHAQRWARLGGSRRPARKRPPDQRSGGNGRPRNRA